MQYINYVSFSIEMKYINYVSFSNLSGPGQHGVPAFNLDVPQRKDESPHRTSKIHFDHPFVRLSSL